MHYLPRKRYPAMFSITNIHTLLFTTTVLNSTEMRMDTELEDAAE